MQLAIGGFGLSVLTFQDPAPLLRFWQDTVGLRFTELYEATRRMHQYRHDLFGSTFKITHLAKDTVAGPASGYRELIVARPGLSAVRELTDPAGNRVRLVPPGSDGVTSSAMRMGVRDVEAHRRHLRDALGFEEIAKGVFAVGDSRIFIEHDSAAPACAGFEGPGYRYLTYVVRNVDRDHAHILASGGKEETPLRTAGEIARFTMMSDPDGNWYELAQRGPFTSSAAN